ncbi:MAG: hypothetical protein U5Q03_17925 [Bacteroidota bacterium]|nr:hypothetical protein [Bacteroidota bacterium]
MDLWNFYNPPIEDPGTISDPMTQSIVTLGTENMIEKPIEISNIYKDEGGQQYLLGSTLNLFKPYTFSGGGDSRDIALLDNNKNIYLSSPLLLGQFDNCQINLIDLSFESDGKYEPDNEVSIRNDLGKVVEYHDENNYTRINVYLDNQRTVKAKAGNTLNKEFFYSSFEDNESQTGTQGDAKAGNYYFAISDNTLTRQINLTQEDLIGNNGYKATIWCKGQTPGYLEIQINNDASSIQTATSSGRPDWELLEVELTRNDLESYQGTINYILVTVGSTNTVLDAFFDEFKVFPVDATITCSTLDEYGNKTSVSGKNNIYQYFEYDGLGNLILSRDDENNILTYNEYNTDNIAMFTAYQTEPGDEIFPGQVYFVPAYKYASNYHIDYGDGFRCKFWPRSNSSFI